jgi:hypothetical protein
VSLPIGRLECSSGLEGEETIAAASFEAEESEEELSAGACG